jgi:hypothetical protein
MFKDCVECFLVIKDCDFSGRCPCKFGIDDSDVEAAAGVAAAAKVDKEKNILERDILRVRLAREKLRFEKEKFYDVRHSAAAKTDLSKMQTFSAFTDDIINRISASFGVSVSELIRDFKEEERQNFFCKNCGEDVLVPVSGVGKKIHWESVACHQQPCFEVAD